MKHFEKLKVQIDGNHKMNEIKADSAYFIKLGRKGKWEEECILHDSTIKLGFINPLHSECLAGEWDKISKYWLGKGKKKGKATEITNQIRTFYESNEKTLWITFFRRKMYWCFAEKDVTRLSDGTRIRKVKAGWKHQDIQGYPLRSASSPRTCSWRPRYRPSRYRLGLTGAATAEP